MPDFGEHDFLVVGANLALAGSAAEVCGALRAAGLSSVLIKGPALTRWLYGSESARASVDVDVLVDPANLVASEAALRDLGYTPAATGIGAAERPRHASAWIRAGSPAVDLHTSVVGIGRSAAESWAILRERTVSESVGGASVEVPAVDARLLLIALHAGQHGERQPQPLRDLARALEIGSRADWSDAASLARSLGAEAAFAAGLGLLEPGRKLRDDLDVVTASTLESALRATTAPALTLGLDWLVRLPGMRPRLRFALRKLFPPAAFMRTWTPVARQGKLGLVAAYVWRPLWMLGRTGPAIRAWRRAKKETRP